MKNDNICLGLLAHVDAGKTTLSEAILYTAGAIRKPGRVDHKTAFLDNNAIEKNRGITVFSKEARFSLEQKVFTLIDTPGHADFSAEAERTLGVLDYAALIISGTDGVQGHTATLWRLLETYNVPVFVFVNKMDQAGADRSKIMKDLNSRLGGGFSEFWDGYPVSDEETAIHDEMLTEEFLDKEKLSPEAVAEAIKRRSIFPVCFGSALKLEGIREFLRTLEKYCLSLSYPKEFGARVYKISRDSGGVRQTHIKITGGKIQSRMPLIIDGREEKIDRIRLYSGKNFESVSEAEAGMICAVTGLSATYAGQGLGAEEGKPSLKPRLEPALTYRVILPEETDAVSALQKLRQIEEEEPTLQIVWKEALQELHVKVMGRLELDILEHIAKERFDMDISFGEGGILYKETIAKPAIGIGHFEPLRHYAEVHLLLEPLERGDGLVFETAVSEDKLDRNWQNLILTHLREREHLGALTGSPITDIRITLIGGKANLKHTEGGDFRQASCRAVRQGLCKAESVLLEPIYSFRAEIPNANVGRLLSDMQRFGADWETPEISESGMSLVSGKGPAAYLKDYPREVSAYTRGGGSFSVSPCGYGECCESRRIIEEKGYRAESDLDNPPGSVFCGGGSSFLVSWDEVDGMAHIDSGYRIAEDGSLMITGHEGQGGDGRRAAALPSGVSQKELDEIFFKTYGKSKRDEALRRERLARGSRTAASRRKDERAGVNKPAGDVTNAASAAGNTLSGAGGVQEGHGKRTSSRSKNGSKISKTSNEPYFVVDGYNVIFAWEELSSLAAVNIDSARETLIEILENYRAYKKAGMVVVFDGYKVRGSKGSTQEYGDLKVVYTKEAQTADRFIEETVYNMGGSFNVTVVTSDMPVQMAALGDGAARMSAREFYAEVTAASEEIRRFLKGQRKVFNRPLENKLPGQ